MILKNYFFTLKSASDILKKSSIIQIKELKNSIDNSNQIEKYRKNFEQYLSKNIINKIKNPEKLYEHILWLIVGTWNIGYTTVKTLYKYMKMNFKNTYWFIFNN